MKIGFSLDDLCIYDKYVFKYLINSLRNKFLNYLLKYFAFYLQVIFSYKKGNF